MEMQRIVLCLAVVFCYCTITAQYSPEDWITELDVVAGDKDVQCKEGFTKIPQDLNMGLEGKYVYACIKKGETYKTPLNSVVVVESSYSMYQYSVDARCPNDRDYELIGTTLSHRVGSERRTYLCFSRGYDTMITSIDFFVQNSNAFPTRTQANGTCNSQYLNDGPGRKFIYMCYSYDSTDIVEIRLEDVVYDWTRKVDSVVDLATVQDVSILNPSDVDTAPATFTGTFNYTSRSKWHLNNLDAYELGHSLMVAAAIPELNFRKGWTASTVQTYNTTVGQGTSTSVQTPYSISCVAPRKTVTECGGVYRQGKISVPYNATKITRYTDGTSAVSNVTGCMYDGTSRAYLQFYQIVSEHLEG